MAFARLIDILLKLIDIGRAPVLGVGIDQAAEMVVEGLDHRGGASCDLLGRAADQIDEDQRLGGLFLGETFKNGRLRSEEHTSELQSLMRISYAVFCLKKKTHKHKYNTTN